MTVYYNENDPKAAAWLRELVRTGMVAYGDVDERSIEDVLPNEIKGYDQCHFFAGIGGWSYALRLAGWPDGQRVWTGSCPCQPFSAAGKGAGFDDKRHLWPAWFHLIRQCQPEVIFGEQVASNLAWLDLVQNDLESEGYATGAAVVGAHSVGAPHIRQRLYWMADRNGARWRQLRSTRLLDRFGSPLRYHADGRRTFVGMADSAGVGRREERADPGRVAEGDCAQGRAAGPQPSGLVGGLGDASGAGAGRDAGAVPPAQAQCDSQRFADGSCRICAESPGAADLRLANPDGGYAGEGREQRGVEHGQQPQDGGVVPLGLAAGLGRARLGDQPAHGSVGQAGAWDGADWIYCRDGKWRPVEPGTFPLAHGIPGRVGLLRGYGNAIVPEVAQAFIEAYLTA